LSQRTRSRTTAAAPAARKPRPAPANPPAIVPAEPEKPQAQAPAAPPSPPPSLAPEALARTLRAVAAELERDPALARRVAAALAAPPDQPDQPDAPSPAPDIPISEKRDDDQPDPTSPRAARAFTPRLITGASSTLGTGIPDPFALHARLGADGLRAALDELRLGSLRAIVREHGLDPGGKASRQNDAARLRALILAAIGLPLSSHGEGAAE
jgi:hypothetical protein